MSGYITKPKYFGEMIMGEENCIMIVKFMNDHLRRKEKIRK